MLILPIGHDRTVHRLPFVTVGIMVVCLAVQVYATVNPPSEAAQDRVKLKLRALVAEVWRAYGAEYRKKYAPDLDLETRELNPQQLLKKVKQVRRVQRRFQEDFIKGRLLPKDDPYHVRLQKLLDEMAENAGVMAYGYRPQKRPTYKLLTYMFVHGGWLHLIGNLIFLWLCGCNMEDRWGPLLWALAYILSGVVAAVVFAARHRFTGTAPLVGASGAIAGAMGAFLIIHHSASIRFWYYFWPMNGTFELRAYWAFPIWLGKEVLGSFTETVVAHSAHVGGFLCGVAVAVVMKVVGFDKRLVEAAEEKSTVFRQDPLYEQAQELVDQGRPQEARQRLEQLLQQDPHHFDAALEAFRLAAAEGDGAVPAARRVLDLAPSDEKTLRDVYEQLRAQQPGQVAALGARHLFAVAQSYREDPRMAFSLYELIASHHADDPLMPKVLLSSADALYKMHKADVAVQVLEGVIANYAGTPYAERAREMLERERGIALE